MEGVTGPAQGTEAGPDRVVSRPRPGPHVRVRRVRAAHHPPGRRIGVGSPGQADPVAGQLQQAARFPAAVRVLLVGDDHLWGRIEPAKGGVPTLRALQSIRARVDDGDRVYVILDNLNHHRGRVIREWCEANNVELCFTPTYASWANPIEAHFGPLRQFVLAASDQADHTALGRAIRSYLRWRNTHTRDPALLEAERRQRARVRSEQQRRWGHPKRPAA